MIFTTFLSIVHDWHFLVRHWPPNLLARIYVVKNLGSQTIVVDFKRMLEHKNAYTNTEERLRLSEISPLSIFIFSSSKTISTNNNVLRFENLRDYCSVVVH